MARARAQRPGASAHASARARRRGGQPRARHSHRAVPRASAGDRTLAAARDPNAARVSATLAALAAPPAPPAPHPHAATPRYAPAPAACMRVDTSWNGFMSTALTTAALPAASALPAKGTLAPPSAAGDISPALPPRGTHPRPRLFARPGEPRRPRGRTPPRRPPPPPSAAAPPRLFPALPRRRRCTARGARHGAASRGAAPRPSVTTYIHHLNPPFHVASHLHTTSTYLSSGSA